MTVSVLFHPVRSVQQVMPSRRNSIAPNMSDDEPKAKRNSLPWMQQAVNLSTIINIIVYGQNFMAIFTTLSAVIWFSTGTLGILATLVYVFTMRVVIYDILSMAIITTLSTSILFCNLYYILL